MMQQSCLTPMDLSEKMEQFEDLVQKKGVASALREEAGAALSHPLDVLNSIKKPLAEATVAVAGTYLAHRFGPAAVEEGTKLLSPLARELGASLKMDAFTGFGPQLALADGVSLGEKSTFAAKLIAKNAKPAELEALDQPVFMTSTGNGGGVGDLNYRTGKAANGDTVHVFDNVKVPDVPTNYFLHQDTTKVYFGHDGPLYVQLPGSVKYRTLDFGKPIQSIQINESAKGLKEYRFNGDKNPAMIVNSTTHDIMGYSANGDRVLIADNNPGGLIFKHSQGGTTRISASGQIEMTPASGAVLKSNVGQPFKQAYFTEHNDGAISLRFSDQNEDMLSGSVRAEATIIAPKVPAPRFNNNTQPSGPTWRNPLARNSPVHSPSDNMDFDRYDASGGHHHQDAMNPFNIPTSPERFIDSKLAGVSGGMVSGNNLDSPADMFTAQAAGGNKWLGRWLMNMGKPEKRGW